MDKSVLSKINSVRAEIMELKEKLKKLNEQSLRIVVDSVKGSSSDYPYIQHNCVIEGIDNKKVNINKRNRNKFLKQIKSKEFKLGKLINKLEYELNYIEDSDIRRIIRFKYEDNMNWIQIQHKMNEKYPRKNYTADGIRMKIERFFKKI